MHVMSEFVGRDLELKRLQELFGLDRACVAVIKGRRRVGKSRLVEEFGRGKVFLSFSGLAPIEGITDQDQRDAFATRLAEQFKLPPFTFTDWSDAFANLTFHLTDQKTVILLDEISWMAFGDPTFVPKLKVWWDLVLQKYPKVVLVFCGSVSIWIDENIINSTAFFGRITLQLEISELSLAESLELLRQKGNSRSDLDVFKILSVTGGIPWYLEQIHPQQSIDENIKRLCFEKNGMLVEEFNRIFRDLFKKRGEIYEKIIKALAKGMQNLDEIRDRVGYALSGSLSQYLDAMETSGYISKHYSWNLKTGHIGRQSLYRISDNYLHFYLKYIQPNLSKIRKNAFLDMPLSSLPGWETMMGFQLENLLLKNRSLVLKALGIAPQDVTADNPYIQKSLVRQKGCQIDYLIQTHSNTFYVCEIKMRKREIGLEVIDAMKEKLRRFSVPKGFGVCPVLLHLGPISDALLESRYFYKILDVADFLDI